MKKIFLLTVLLTFTSIFAQDINSYIELLRADVKAEKKALITEVMSFTEQESSLFWPTYREYDLKLDKLGDERVAFIKEFAENYEKMTDEKADQIMESAFDYQENRIELRRDMYNEIKEKIGPAKAAKFIQLEHQIQLLIDLKINSELPLLEKTGFEKETK